jgi:hypothetical protein
MSTAELPPERGLAKEENMIDPILSLAFSMYSNKGVYALLLGSGVSRSSGIPTGWEVILDLIRKLAHAQGINCEPDPVEWYVNTFHEEPDYSKILKDVAFKPSERSQLLRSYFEPSDDERARGIKLPTDAHKAIARLVAGGYIRVIITTNFDRLIERSLEDVGIIPTVIGTPDVAQGALPLVHTKCAILKVHGDYLDTRIKNTPEELSTYHTKINKLLDRIFDEYGLIVCGWSAAWDIALQNALKRCKSRRFTTYWAIKGDLSDPAKTLVDQRQAQIIPIASADAFFREVEEKVLSLSDYEHPHPLSSKVAVVTLKRYLEDGKNRIRLHDLVMDEVESVHKNTSPESLPTNIRFTSDELLRRIQKYDSLVEVLQAMLITGSYWGNDEMGDLITRSLERLSDSLNNQPLYQPGFNLELYPALVLLYSAGIASLAKGNYETLASGLVRPQCRVQPRGSKPLVLALYPSNVMDVNTGRILPKRERHYFPLNDYLLETLAGSLKEFLPDKNQFSETFDRFEFLLALVFTDESLQRSEHNWIPVGPFAWKYAHGAGYQIALVISQEIEKSGDNWLPLTAGFFGGSVDRAKKALAEVLAFLKDRANYLMG